MAECKWLTWGKFGPTVVIQSVGAQLQAIHAHLKAKWDDKPISLPGVKHFPLYYYFGDLGHWGKAGFRISGHTKKRASVGASSTHGVLHISNP